MVIRHGLWDVVAMGAHRKLGAEWPKGEKLRIGRGQRGGRMEMRGEEMIRNAFLSRRRVVVRESHCGQVLDGGQWRIAGRNGTVRIGWYDRCD